ncbi:MAG: hypothetical protein GY913_04770 [Proteobacteria bacterium]|nr:hypothetical protein [Pseudomonadota bacterium]MCP4916214.1 hypothetical protein [Pseudomonadota bacterium]
MDLIGQLGSTLGLETIQAAALAGSALSGIQGAVADNDEGAAAELAAAVPELDDWKKTADATLGEEESGGLGGPLGGGAGGLLGAAAGALGGQEAQNTVAIAGVLAKLDVSPGKAALVAPIILSFLKTRMKPETLQMVITAAPMLAALKGDDDEGAEAPAAGGVDAGSLLGAAGKLFG